MPLDPAKIRLRRERLGLTQADAAERAGLLRPNWARLEAGDKLDVHLSTAEAVAAALGTTLSRLLAE